MRDDKTRRLVTPENYQGSPAIPTCCQDDKQTRYIDHALTMIDLWANALFRFRRKMEISVQREKKSETAGVEANKVQHRC